MDERALIDLGTVYNESAKRREGHDLYRSEYLRRRRSRPDLDANDEIVFMGDRRWISRRRRARIRPGWSPEAVRRCASTTPSAIRPTLSSTCTGRRATSTPSAGRPYVDYDVQPPLGRLQDAPTSSHDGPNPEDSTVTTRFYSTTSPIAGRRRRAQDHRAAAPPASTSSTATRTSSPPATAGAARTRSTTREGAFIVNKSGPVRAIRSYIGANSGPLHPARAHLLRPAGGHRAPSSGSTRSPGSWTSSTTARRRPA